MSMSTLVHHTQTVLAAGALIHLLHVWRMEGVKGLVRTVFGLVRLLPGVNALIGRVLAGEVKSAVKLLTASGPSSSGEATAGAPAHVIPEIGISEDELMKEMDEMRASEQHIKQGTVFAYVYTLPSHAHERLMAQAHTLFGEGSQLGPAHGAFLERVYQAFMHGNALNPSVFPSLRRMEVETIAMTAAMLNGDSGVVGSLTSGGTESVLMAIKTYRDRARAIRPDITEPEAIAPITIHPAFEKAAHYFGVKIIHVPIGDDYRPNVNVVRKAITRNTIVLLASAPQYCHGVVDPIPELSALALEKGLPLHVDACFGGFMLPWIEKLGHHVPPFDFRNPGVTSMSADIHKYGYGPKGASVILYRNNDLRKYQYFAYSTWPGGLFGSPSMAGTRPGGNIAQAWATLRNLGQDGFTKVARDLMSVTRDIQAAVNAIPELEIMGTPHMTAFAFRSKSPSFDIQAFADVMDKKGWRMERQQHPSCLHCSILPHHLDSKDRFITDLAEAAITVRAQPELARTGTAAMYGMMAKLPDSGLLDDFIVGFFSEMYTA